MACQSKLRPGLVVSSDNCEEKDEKKRTLEGRFKLSGARRHEYVLPDARELAKTCGADEEIDLLDSQCFFLTGRHEETYGSQAVVNGSNDQRVAHPDEARRSKG